MESMVDFAYRSVPLWRDVFDKAGVKPGQIRTRADLARLPLSSKKTLLERPVKDRVGIAESDCVKMSTSGTTGGPMPVFYSKKFYDYGNVMVQFWVRGRQGASAFSKNAMITYDARAHASRETEARPLPVRRGNVLGALTPVAGRVYDAQTRRFFISNSVEEILPGMIEFRPGRITGSPAYLRLLADAVKSRHETRLRPRSVLTLGEPLDGPTRAHIEEAFGCNVFDGYGCNETWVIATECSHKTLHVWTDSVIVEVLKDGRQARPGEEGDIYVTTLRNEAMPLFRYDMGDRGVAGDSTCPCGWRTPTLKSVEGRRVDYVSASDGRPVSPKRVSTLMNAVTGMPRCQLVEVSGSQFVLRVFGGNEDAERSLIESLQKELGDVTIRVSHEKPDALGIKFRPVVSHVAASSPR